MYARVREKEKNTYARVATGATHAPRENYENCRMHVGVEMRGVCLYTRLTYAYRVYERQDETMT